MAEAFTETPFGRYRTDGDESGEVFREDILLPALEKHHYVSVLLDGLAGLPSSVWEEVMGGLIRRGKDFEWLREHLRIETNEAEMNTFVRLGWKYAEEESKRSRNN